jgi:cell division protein FtsZ
MRVTVIATGIGTETAVEKPVEKEREKEKRVVQHLRGKIRDVSPSDNERSDIIDFDEPTFIRNRRAVGETPGALHRGVGRMALDDNDLDVPTFLRRKAD